MGSRELPLYSVLIIFVKYKLKEACTERNTASAFCNILQALCSIKTEDLTLITILGQRLKKRIGLSLQPGNSYFGIEVRIYIKLEVSLVFNDFRIIMVAGN